MRVSIVTVSLNSSKTIKDCIDSVNSQNYPQIEHVLVDGGSLDSTVEKFQLYARRNPIFISERDKGIYDAMNKGIALCSGEIVGFLNSDDYFTSENVITDIVSSFKRGVDIVHGNLIFVDTNGKVKRRWDSSHFCSKDLLRSMSPCHPTVYCKKSLITELNGFDTSFKIAGDIDFFIRALLVKNSTLEHINDTLVTMRLGGLSTRSLKSVLLITLEVWASFEKNRIKFSRIKYIVGKFKKIINQTWYDSTFFK